MADQGKRTRSGGRAKRGEQPGLGLEGDMRVTSETLGPPIEDDFLPSDESGKPETDQPYHLLGLHIRNFMRIELAKITPDGSLVILKGANGAGKSSIVKALESVLGGKRMMPDEPLRRGSEVGEIVAQLGLPGQEPALIATRHLTETGSELHLESPLGPVKAAQTALDVLRGDLSFDPIAFLGMEAKKQTEQLLAVAGLDFTQLEIDRQEIFERRTEVGQKQRAAKALWEEARPTDGTDVFDVPEEYDLEPLREEVETTRAALSEGERSEETVQHAIQRWEQLRRQVDEKASEMARISGDLERLHAEAATAERTHQEAAAAAAGVDLINLSNMAGLAVATLEGTAQAHQERASIVEKQARLDGFRRDLETETAAYDEATEEIEALDQEKQDALQTAVFPVEGLSVEESGPNFNGLPLGQASESDLLRISVAMAMAVSPKLGLALVRSGSGLGPEQIARIHELVRERKGQVIIETIHAEDGQEGIVLVEDGFAGEAVTS